MAFKTFTAGAVLTASDVNTYLAKQAVIVCTSTTRPSSPPEGMVIYETDTDKLLAYTTATTGWVPPWNMPWGRVAYAEITTNSSTFTTVADITGLSLTQTAVANRKWRVWVKAQLQSSVGTDAVAVYIRKGDGTQIGQMALGNVNGASDVCGFAEWTTTAGSVTWKLVGERYAGTGNAKIGANSTIPAFIMIEDIGPAGAPA